MSLQLIDKVFASRYPARSFKSLKDMLLYFIIIFVLIRNVYLSICLVCLFVPPKRLHQSSLTFREHSPGYAEGFRLIHIEIHYKTVIKRLGYTTFYNFFLSNIKMSFQLNDKVMIADVRQVGSSPSRICYCISLLFCIDTARDLSVHLSF